MKDLLIDRMNEETTGMIINGKKIVYCGAALSEIPLPRADWEMHTGDGPATLVIRGKDAPPPGLAALVGKPVVLKFKRMVYEDGKLNPIQPEYIEAQFLGLVESPGEYGCALLPTRFDVGDDPAPLLLPHTPEEDPV